MPPARHLQPPRRCPDSDLTKYYYSLEIFLVDEQRTRDEDSWVVSRAELLRRFAALPDTFPQSKRYAAELTAGTGHDRFDFTIGLMIDGLARR